MFKPNKRLIKQSKTLFDTWALAQTLAWPGMWDYKFYEDSPGGNGHEDKHFIAGVLKAEAEWPQRFQYIQYDYQTTEWRFYFEYVYDTENPYVKGHPGFFPRAVKGITQKQFIFLQNYKDHMQSVVNYRLKNKLMDDAGVVGIGGSGWDVSINFKDFKSVKKFFKDFINNNLEEYDCGENYLHYLSIV